MTMFEFRLKFRLSLLLWVQLTVSQHWFRRQGDKPLSEPMDYFTDAYMRHLAAKEQWLYTKTVSIGIIWKWDFHL